MLKKKMLNQFSARSVALAAMFGLVGITQSALGAISAGGLAVVGFTDDDSGAGGTDDFTFLATEDIGIGEVVYFTNNGWSSSGASSGFYGKAPGSDAGARNLLKMTVTGNIQAGTVISTALDALGLYEWTNSGTISGGAPSYSKLDLANSDGFSALGDRIYIFQSTQEISPIVVSPDKLSFIYLLDNGEPNSPGFEEPVDAMTGANVPTNLSAVNQTLSVFGKTAVELSPTTGLPLGFHGGSFTLDMSNPNIIALQTAGGYKEDWLNAIANPDNWTSAPIIQGPLLVLSSVVAAPEPSRVTLLAGALGAIFLRRRRQ